MEKKLWAVSGKSDSHNKSFCLHQKKLKQCEITIIIAESAC